MQASFNSRIIAYCLYGFCSLGLLSLNSCEQAGETATHTNASTADNSRNAVDWQGYYVGKIPCADCAGIGIELILYNDGSYNLRQLYDKEGEKIRTSEGKFSWTDDGSKISLDASGDNMRFLVGENQIFFLDQEGNRITGSLEEHYILKKQSVNLRDTHWFLSEIGGHAVEPPAREGLLPYFVIEGEKVSGYAACNRFHGGVKEIGTTKLQFAQLAGTLMACDEKAMKLENDFHNMMEKVRHYDYENETLVLKDSLEIVLGKFQPHFIVNK